MRVAIVFINIGNYHVARINAAQNACEKRGWELEAIQVTSNTLEHAWGDPTDKLNHLVHFSTLFESTAYDTADHCFPFSREAGQRLTRHFTISKPDAVLLPGWSFSVATAGLKWCRKNNKIAVLASESNEFDSPRQWYRELFKSMRVKQFSSALVGGRSHARYLAKLGFDERKIAYGYDVVDNDSFSPSIIRQRPKPHPNAYILLVGRLVPKKNLCFVIEAYAEYCRKTQSKRLDLVICGDGPERESVESLAKSHGVSANVRITGFLEMEDLKPFYAHAACFVHASTEEQWGLVVNEAIAAALPVLVSTSTGCFEDLVVVGENGFGFDPRNQTELTTRMLSIDPESERFKAMGEASLARSKLFPVELFGQGLMSAIDRAVCSQP